MQKQISIPLIVAVLILILLISSSCYVNLDALLKEIEQEKTINTGTTPTTEKEGENDYSQIKPGLARTSGFDISYEDENKFNTFLEENCSSEKLGNAKLMLGELKKNFPKGYFVIAKSTIFFLEDDKDFAVQSLNAFGANFTPLDMSTWVHEDIHTLSFWPAVRIYGFGKKDFEKIIFNPNKGTINQIYLITDFGVWLKRDGELFQRAEIYEDIENPEDFDRTYLDREGSKEADIFGILDEINAYTHTTQTAIALEDLVEHGTSNSTRYGLLKQMMHLEMYLKRANEKHPKVWEYITKNTGLSFFIMKLWEQAARFEDYIKDDYRFNLNSQPVADFLYDPPNYSIMDKLFTESGIVEFKSKGFEDVEFDGYKIYYLEHPE
ncbi:MAG: hypothetical protein M1371_00045 [Actinobacteria bacterium]|nr:hypothetical protein [Actinomycetota bacterium]